jgi:hypothetical protein
MASAVPEAALDEDYAGMLEDLAFAAEVGDMSEEDVLAEALAEYQTDPRAIAAAVGYAFMEKRAREVSFPLVTACDRIDAAFANLRKAGFVAIQAAGGSIEEGMAMVEAACATEDEEDRWAFVFFHLEDIVKAIDHGCMKLEFGTIPLATGERGRWPAEIAGDIVVEALHEAGLTTLWDGTASKRIQVQMVWQKRCPSGRAPTLLN